MADAAAGLEEVCDPLVGHEAADFGVVLRVLRGRRGDGVVKRDRQTLRITHTKCADLPECAGNGRGVIVT